MDKDLDCEFYFPKKLIFYCAKTSALDLDKKVFAPISGLDIISPESNIQLINLHAFVARLSSVNTCDVGFYVVEEMCFIIIKSYGVRSNRVIFNVAVSAAAQHMIYWASYLFKFTIKNLGYQNGFLGWQK